MNIEELLQAMNKEGVSDLHLSVGLPPIFRTMGVIKRFGSQVLTNSDILQMLNRVIPADKKIIPGQDMDLGVEVGNIGRFRANIYYDNNGICAAFRLIPNQIKSLQELGLPNIVERVYHMRRGLVLVTGVAGSGKSTTLASIVELMNNKRQAHIITIEDPIEFVHKNKECVINQREVGTHVSSFTNALNSALREDPDVILVGEMRNLDTISMTITAAETGHLVFATLHTKDATQTVNRIIDIFPPHQQDQIRVQLAETLKMVISQVLIPSADGKGRHLACELMVVTPGIRQLIRDKKAFQMKSSIQSGGEKFGMQTLEESMKKLANGGKINLGDAYHWLYDEGIFEKL